MPTGVTALTVSDINSVTTSSFSTNGSAGATDGDGGRNVQQIHLRADAFSSSTPESLGSGVNFGVFGGATIDTVCQ